MIGEALATFIAGAIVAILIQDMIRDDSSSLKKQLRQSKEQLKKAQNNNGHWRAYASELRETIIKLEDVIRRLQLNLARHQDSTANPDKELMKRAAKIAMMNSHPDRSGTNQTAEDFIQFKRLYDDLRNN